MKHSTSKRAEIGRLNALMGVDGAPLAGEIAPRETFLTGLQYNEITLHPAYSPYHVKLGLILAALFLGDLDSGHLPSH